MFVRSSDDDFRRGGDSILNTAIHVTSCKTCHIMQISMGWDANESGMALAEAGGNVLVAAEALAAREEDDLERYKSDICK